MKRLRLLFSLCFCALALTSLANEALSQTKKPKRAAKIVKKKTVASPERFPASFFEATPGGAEILPGGEYVNYILGFRYTAPKPYEPVLPINGLLRNHASFVKSADDQSVQVSMWGNRLQYCRSSAEYADGEEESLSKKMNEFETVEKSETQIGGLGAVRLVYKFVNSETKTVFWDSFYVCRPMGNTAFTYQFSMTASAGVYEKYKNILEETVRTVKFERPTK